MHEIVWEHTIGTFVVGWTPKYITDGLEKRSDLQTSTVQEHRHSYRGGTRAIEIRPEIGVVRSRSHFGTFTNRRNARE